MKELEKHLTLFDSVEKIIQYFNFGKDGPIHLMLFDPQDGCYHTYFSKSEKSSGKKISVQNFTNIITALGQYFKCFEYKKVIGWIERNVKEDEKRKLALKILETRTSKKINRTGMKLTTYLADNHIREALQIILSALPSYYRWDICGYYDKYYPQRDIDYSEWIFDYAEYRISGYSINTETLKKEAICNKLKYKKFESYQLPQGQYIPVKPPYQALYDKLVEIIHPEFKKMIYCPVTISQVLVGIMFFRVNKDNDNLTLALIKALNDLRIEKHRDLIPVLEKLWLTEFDKLMFKDISLYKNYDAILKIFCENINYIVRCEKCFLVKKDKNKIREIAKWEWTGEETKNNSKSIFREFRKRSVTHNNIMTLKNIDKHIDRNEHIFYKKEYIATRVDYKVEGHEEDYFIYLLTKGKKLLKKSPKSDYLKRYILQRENILYQKLNSVVDKLYPQIENVRRHSTKAAMTAIMSRNLSHNIGSHVLSYWNQELEKTSNNNCQTNIKKSKNLFEYIQHRMDFLAEVSTSIPCSEMSLDIETDILNPIIKPDERSVLLEYLAHSEHIDLHSKITTEVDKKLKSKHVSIPNGLIGTHAIYSVLENFIRNAAKHYKGNGKADNGFIKIVIVEPSKNKWKNKYLTMQIWDIRKNSCDRNVVKKLREYLPGGKKYEFTDEGRIAPGGWGFKEMLTSANFLRKNDPEILMNPELLKTGNPNGEPPLFEILCGDDGGGQPCCITRNGNCLHKTEYKNKLGIQLYLRKPKDLAVAINSFGEKAIKKEIFEIEKIVLPEHNKRLKEEIPHRILLVENNNLQKQYENIPNTPCRIMTRNDTTTINDEFYLNLYERFIKEKIGGSDNELPQLSYQGQIESGGGGFFINNNGVLTEVSASITRYIMRDNNEKEWRWTNKCKQENGKAFYTYIEKLQNTVIFYYHADKDSEALNLEKLVEKKIYVQPVSGGYSTKTKLESLKNVSDFKIQRHLVLELIESALTKVAIIDERVSEWAKENFNNVKKSDLLKNMKVFIIDVNLDKVSANDISFKLTELGYVHFCVIHQGILDKLEKEQGASINFMRNVVSERCLWKVIDSGRGVPSELFEDVRFIEISTLLKMISEYDKHALVQSLFSSRRPEAERRDRDGIS